MIMMVNAIGVLGRDTKMDRRECGASIGKIKENEREKDRDDRNRSGSAPLWQWNRTLDDGHHRNRLSLLEI